jgi:hypothetical protein
LELGLRSYYRNLGFLANDQAHRKNKDAKRSGAALFCPSAAPCYALSFFAITALRAADVFVSYNQITIDH